MASYEEDNSIGGGCRRPSPGASSSIFDRSEHSTGFDGGNNRHSSEARPTQIYSCGHPVDRNGRRVLNARFKTCRACSWRQLFDDMDAIRLRDGLKVKCLLSNLEISYDWFVEAMNNDDHEIASHILERRREWLAELARLEGPAIRQKQRWVARWGEPTLEELGRWDKWWRELWGINFPPEDAPNPSSPGSPFGSSGYW